MFLINVDYISSFTLATIALEASLLLNINSLKARCPTHATKAYFILSSSGFSGLSYCLGAMERGEILTLPHVACMAPRESHITTLSFGLSISKLKRSER